jgi:hypothetical protein
MPGMLLFSDPTMLDIPVWASTISAAENVDEAM